MPLTTNASDSGPVELADTVAEKPGLSITSESLTAINPIKSLTSPFLVVPAIPMPQAYIWP